MSILRIYSGQLAKTLALQQYRLKQEDIKGLPFKKRMYVHNLSLISSGYNARTMAAY